MRIDDACSIALDGTDRKSVKGVTLTYNCGAKLQCYMPLLVYINAAEKQHGRTPNMVYIHIMCISQTLKYKPYVHL